MIISNPAVSAETAQACSRFALRRAVIFYSTGTLQNHIFSNALQPSTRFEPTLLRKKEGYLCCCVVPIVHRLDKDKVQNTQQEDDLH